MRIPSGRRAGASMRSASFMRALYEFEPTGQLDAASRVPASRIENPTGSRLMTPRPILALAAPLRVLAPPARAAHRQESIMQDDRMLLNYGTGLQKLALDEM